MNLSAKIHSVKHFVQYAYYSKSKFRIHSPFVFKFIENILTPPLSKEVKLPQRLINYYTKTEGSISIVENAGQGSNIIDTKSIGIKSFINKVAIPKKYGKILNKICAYYQIENVIELGTSLGVSTAYFANSPDVKVTTVEANKGIYAKYNEAFKTLGVENVSGVNASFDEVLEPLLENINKRTLIFIDGDHNKESCLRYFYKCLEKVQEDSVIIFDDIYWSKGMTEAWYEISKNEKVQLSLDLYRMGILFFNKERKEKEHFKLWY